MRNGGTRGGRNVARRIRTRHGIVVDCVHSVLTTALRIARARGYITPADFAAVDAVLDRVRGMLWRLTH